MHLLYFILHAMQWYDFIREGKEQNYLIFQWSLYTRSKLGDSVLSLEELTPESWDWKQRLAVINLLHRNWSLVCYLRPFVPRRSEKTNCNSALFFSRIFQVHSCAPAKSQKNVYRIVLCVCVHAGVHMYIAQTKARKRFVSDKILS